MNGQQDITQGGALIFITDGKQDCNGGIDIEDENVINRIIKTKVRIITVAFGLVTLYFTSIVPLQRFFFQRGTPIFYVVFISEKILTLDLKILLQLVVVKPTL